MPGAAVRLAESTLVARGDARVPRPDGNPPAASVSRAAWFNWCSGYLREAALINAKRSISAECLLMKPTGLHAASMTMYREEEPPALKCGGRERNLVSVPTK